MNRLYLIRHGESEWNILDKVQGQFNTSLTQKGIAQANLVAKRLINEKIDVVYSSDLDRAYNTAKIIADTIGMKVNKLQDLREIKFGIWEGLSSTEIKEKYMKEHIIWRTEPHKLQLPEAEKLIEVQERMLKGVNELIKKHDDKNILIVSHGSAIKALILGILDIDLSNYNKIAISNTGLSIIEYREYSPVIKVLNDSCHLMEV